MFEDDIKNRINNLTNMIGNTPLLEIKLTYKGELRSIYAKAEYYNLTGSIKDRMAFHILSKAHKSGILKPGRTIIEATSGNTGISFSAIGRVLRNNVIIFMPDWMSEERKNLIKSYGANIKLVSKKQGGFMGSIKMAEELAAKMEYSFLPYQFSNCDNCESHYLTTGPEIWGQLQMKGLTPDAVLAGVGTGGTIMGIGKYLKEKNSKIKIHPLEPSNSPTLSTGYKVGHHRIQGISDEFIPPILKLNELDEIISVDDGDAIIMAQMLASTLGIGVGISSGANLIGAIKVQNMLGSSSIVVTVFPDDNKKYLSTDLMKLEPLNDNFISKDVELVGIKAF
jgi:cysteine synthase A